MILIGQHWTGAVYDLTISSTAGGNVTIPGEGTFPYDAGTVVSLNVTPDAGFRFHEWTGDVGTIADVTAAATTITMNDSCSITAYFEANFMVAAGFYHTVGLRSDGTVVAAGANEYGCCDVGGWTDITPVAAGWDYTVGVKSDGTVVAVGDNEVGQCNVGS